MAWVGLSLMLEDIFAQATYPLFCEDQVDILEWSFDMGWGNTFVPNWAKELIDFYSAQNRLIGHGVSFSLLTAKWTQREQMWLEHMAKEVAARKYLHISEHFGFMAAGSFHRGAPLPVPLTLEALEIGTERLQRFAQVARVPVGLENLAFAFGLQDVEQQGVFLEKLLQSVDGFLLLDLHNVFCQMCNFQLSMDEIVANYPLSRVQELHVSGGSWSEFGQQKIRRDTHDEAVPEEVFALVEKALQMCPNVKAVIFERLGHTLCSSEEIENFQKDFYRLRELVQNATRKTS